MYFLGLDVGGTKIEAALFVWQELSESQLKVAGEAAGVGEKTERLILVNNRSHYLQRLATQRTPTERDKGYDHILKNMSELVKDVCSQAKVKLSDLAGIGIGLPGSVDPKSEMMVQGNTMAFAQRPLSADLKHQLGIQPDVFIDNDANCFALAESYCGAGRLYTEQTGIDITKQTSVGVILGTGCGGGIVIRGQILSGKNGSAGEIGHNSLVDHGYPCYCGRNGCAEQYLSGPAIEAQYGLRMAAEVKERPAAAEVFKLFEQEDPPALVVVQEYKENLSKFLGQLTNVLDPDYFVLGGGVSLQPVLYKGLSEMVQKYCFLPSTRPHVYKHQLGDSAGVVGAALLPIHENSH